MREDKGKTKDGSPLLKSKLFLVALKKVERIGRREI